MNVEKIEKLIARLAMPEYRNEVDLNNWGSCIAGHACYMEGIESTPFSFESAMSILGLDYDTASKLFDECDDLRGCNRDTHSAIAIGKLTRLLHGYDP